MSIFCLLLFAALLLNTTYLQYGVDAGQPQLARGRRARARRGVLPRGRATAIRVAGGDSVAESKKVNDQYVYKR